MKRCILAAVFFFLLLSAMSMALPVAAAAVDVEHTFVVTVYIYRSACILFVVNKIMHGNVCAYI